MAASKFTKNYLCGYCNGPVDTENADILHTCKCGKNIECSKYDICKNNCGKIRKHNMKCKLKSTFECKKCKQTKSIKLYVRDAEKCKDCLHYEKVNSEKWELDMEHLKND